MTISEFARTVIEDPAYRESIVARAKAGTLPEAIELFLLEEFQLADGRLPASVARSGAAPEQSKTFALVRPSAFIEEVQP